MRAVIMAGGKGTRLWEVKKDIPKPMFLIKGKPILEYQIESLKKSGIKHIIIIIGYLGKTITSYFGDGSKWNVKIEYIVEQEPLGTAGAFYYLKEKINEDFLLVFGDLLFDVDFNRFISFHKKHNGSITLFGHPNSHPFDSDLLEIDKQGCVQKIYSKQDNRDFYYKNLVNAGVYCINSTVLMDFTEAKKVDLEKEVIAAELLRKKVFVYRSSEYVKDMGTPERLEEVENDLQNGLVYAKNLMYKQKAVFLDRDGTINKYVGFLRNVSEFELLPTVAKAIRKLNKSGYLVIVTTNQPVIARGECSMEELESIHKRMETELGEHGAYVDDIFYCPHHPDKGFVGEISELKFDCDCRKPKIGMLLKAEERYNISRNDAWYIGDSTVDVQTGVNAGIKTILLHSGEAGRDRKYHISADYEAVNLEKAVDKILFLDKCKTDSSKRRS